MTDSMRRRIQIRLIILPKLRARLESEYCKGRIPDVIHYSAEAWRSGKSRDFHRRASTKGTQPRRLTSLCWFPSWKGGNLLRLPRSEDFLSISRRDRKAHPAARGGALTSSVRIASSAHTRFPLYDTPRRFCAMPRFRWIFLGRIHNVHLCTGQ